MSQVQPTESIKITLTIFFRGILSNNTDILSRYICGYVNIIDHGIRIYMSCVCQKL